VRRRTPVSGEGGVGLRARKGGGPLHAVGRGLALAPALLVREQQRFLLVLLLPPGRLRRARNGVAAKEPCASDSRSGRAKSVGSSFGMIVCSGHRS